MSVTMGSWQNKRKGWATARDGAHVKKGAVSGVSIGDRLDKLVKASGKGYKPLLAAIAALQKDVTTYQTKGGKAVAPVAGWLKTLSNDLIPLKQAAEADAAKLAKINPSVTELHKLYVPGLPIPHLAENTKERIAADKTGATTWLDAAKQTNIFAALPRVSKAWVDFIKLVRGASFDMELPGMAAQYAALKDADEDYRTCYKLLMALWKSTSYDDYLGCKHALGVPMQNLEVYTLPAVHNAVTALLG